MSIFNGISFFRKEKGKLFICGIGGIGTSGLALLARSCGYNVYGSNEEENLNTQKLQKFGIDIKIGHDPKNLGDCDIFVYSRAIDLSTNVEAIEAKARQIVMCERGVMLTNLMLNYFNIVIAGSHGKTTTTGLIGNMLYKLNEKPNILIGGVLNECDTNCQLGGKRYFVVESDESDGSFLGMPANIGVITSIDPEHMEFYKTVDNLEYYFYRFAQKIIDNGGFVVVCIDDKVGVNIATKYKNNDHVITYSACNKEADFFYENVRFKKDGIIFDVYNNFTKSYQKDVYLTNMFGEINALNSLAVFAVGRILNKDINDVAKTFSVFKGIQKRFTVVGKCENTIVVDDYAHNPQKINSAIGSARHYMQCNGLNGKLTVIFEPHRYTRVRDSMDLFSKVLDKADNVIVLPIYASSEREIEGIDQNYVVRKCKERNSNVFACKLDINDVKRKLNEIGAFGSDNLIVIMGAGRSSKFAHQIVEE